MTETIISQLAEYIAKEIIKRPDREIKADEPLLTSGLVDSFSLVDLSLFIEDTFEVLIDDTELNAETFDTLQQLAGILAENHPPMASQSPIFFFRCGRVPGSPAFM